MANQLNKQRISSLYFNLLSNAKPKHQQILKLKAETYFKT